MLISFIVPVYNAGEYLKPCVDSLLGQSYREIEVILVDDGSTDNSPALCDAFAQSDSRVRVFHKENGGVHTARNLGISRSEGRYIMFVDADDWIDPETTERVMEIIEAHQPDVVRFTYTREFENDSVKKSNTFVKDGLSRAEACRKIYRQTMGLIEYEWAHPENFNFLATTCTSAYKRSLIVDNGVEFEPREPIGSFEDGLFNLKVMVHAERFYYMDQAFYHYRKTNAESCTANYRTNYLEKQGKLFDQLYTMALASEDPQLMEAFYNRVVFSNLELCLNALKSSKTGKEKRLEIKRILTSPLHIKAGKYMELGYYTLKWKVYFFLVKHRLVYPVYLMTSVIRRLQKRG